MGFRNNFLKGCAILLTSLAIISCLSACKDKTPPVEEIETKYEVSVSTLDTQTAYTTLKGKLIDAYSDLDEIENADWNQLSILYVHQDNETFRDLCITAAVPVDDSDYEYCLITAQHRAPTYQYDSLTGFKNIGSLYQTNSQNKENVITYYSGSDFGAIAENFKEDEYEVTSSLIDDTYYTMSDSIKEMVMNACDDDRLEQSGFFTGSKLTSYLTLVDDKEVHIYNTETMGMVKLTYSNNFVSFQESQKYLINGTYSTYDIEQLKSIGYSFTPLDQLEITKKK